jgi:hypothetical protein
MGIECWSEVLEFPIGNPVLVGYLAYIVGLLIAIAVVKAAETAELAQANEQGRSSTAARAMRSVVLRRISPMSKSVGCLYSMTRIASWVSFRPAIWPRAEMAVRRKYPTSLLITRISLRRYPRSPKLVATTVRFYRIAKGSAPSRRPTPMLRSRSSVLSNETPV